MDWCTRDKAAGFAVHGYAVMLRVLHKWGQWIRNTFSNYYF